jgi:SAM-dependent methyltransferase
MFNKRAREAGIPPDAMMALRGDLLLDDDLPSPDLHGFDIAVMSMALHHVEDPGKILSELVKRLNPGGVIAVLDWVPDESGKHGCGNGHDPGCAHKKSSFAAHTINREDLGPRNIFAWLRDAGCNLEGAYYVVVGDASHIPEQLVDTPGGEWKNLFFAYATRKA